MTTDELKPGTCRWVPCSERLPEEMGFYICWMDAEPDMGPRIDIVFYAIKGPGSMAVRETGWGKPVLYDWANWKVLYWHPFPDPPKVKKLVKREVEAKEVIRWCGTKPLMAQIQVPLPDTARNIKVTYEEEVEE